MDVQSRLTFAKTAKVAKFILKDSDFFGAPDDKVFVAGRNLDEILALVANFNGPMARKVIDLFCGPTGQVHASSVEAGHVAEKFDYLVGGEGHNFLTKDGFFVALKMVLHCAPGSLIVGGPPCSLFVWLSLGFTKRNEKIEGDTTKASVLASNALVHNMVVLLAIAHCRGVWFLLEQPSTSRMYRADFLAEFLAQVNPHRIWTWMRCFGHDMDKPTVLYATLPFAFRLKRILRMGAAKAKTNKNYHSKTKDGRWVQGGPDLQSSAQYTPGFATAILDCWGRACRSFGSPEPQSQDCLVALLHKAKITDEATIVRYLLSPAQSSPAETMAKAKTSPETNGKTPKGAPLTNRANKQDGKATVSGPQKKQKKQLTLTAMFAKTS